MRGKPQEYLIGSLIVFLLLSGCSNKKDLDRASISGTVMFDEQPIEQGTIEFIATGDTSAPSSGGTISNGQYEVTEKGPVPGRYKVQIQARRKTGKMVSAGPQTGGAQVEEVEQFIPTQYNSQTTLEVEIKPGSNKQDFQLKSKQ